MNLKMLMALCIAYLCTDNFAFDLPLSVSNECTTNEKIFHRTEIRNQVVSRELKREAILRAVGVSNSDIGFNTQHFKGLWFYEYEDESAIYAGFKVRSHYLKVAIVIGENSVSTLVCDSRNLKQKPRSIHRKVPLWKDQLNSKIRIELGNVGRNAKTPSKAIALENLDALRSQQIITDQEYSELKSRIEE